jgi:hypothetical protein
MSKWNLYKNFMMNMIINILVFTFNDGRRCFEFPRTNTNLCCCLNQQKELVSN